jgi:hypothetical protein
MNNTMVRLGPTLLLSVLMIAGTAPASAAGTLVKVTFGGTGFSGWFEYDQSLRDSTPGTFNFQGSALTHKICYTITSAACVPFSGTACEPYTITTNSGSDRTFELKVTAPKSPSTQAVIVLPMGITLSQTSLPLCPSFPSTPNSGSTFTLSGATSFTGTITTLQCSAAAFVTPAPAGQAGPIAPAAYYADDRYPAPAPYPVYAFQPRPACCLSSRLFCRGSVRLGGCR